MVLIRNVVFVCFFSIIVSSVAFAGTKKKSLSCQVSFQRLKKLSLMMSQGERKRLFSLSVGAKRPVPNARHRKLIKKYSLLRRLFKKQRTCYLRKIRRLHRASATKKLAKKIEQKMLRYMDQVLLPLWIGTPWDFYGTAEKPHQKKIACGYFVIHALLSVGFQLPENFVYTTKSGRKMRIYELAKLAASNMAKHISSKRLTYIAKTQSIRELQKGLDRFGPGLYLMGLSSHVGLVLYDGKEAILWHSDYLKPWVKRESLWTAEVVLTSNYRMLSKIRWQRYIDWAYGRPIRIKPRRKRRRR